ncbi:Hypothetical predicted protein [Mytilus galloprovincialis]|uniref:Uncharacterized protein n=1 Tax=Mytilus galloprovincialis TaxID=29158 RepID=A0A8B6BZS1_MYTGA|nr:Hypothetical predicted protein [Mytilus galloprovincialis]
MFNSPYVSDVLAWEESIKKASNRKKRVNNQSGGGLSKRYSRKRRFVFPKNKLPTNEPKVELVASTVAIEDRAESELKHQKQDKTPYIGRKKSSSMSKGIKGKNSKKQSISIVNSKGVRAQKSSKKKKTLGKRRKQNRVRRLDFDTTPSIFDRVKTK